MHFRIVILLVALQICCCISLKLEQVLILSRHNVRTPLSKNLNEFTPKKWPAWNEKSGYLTAKGAILEGYMGVFFSAWLTEAGLLTSICPDEKILYVYANTAQRTMASAKAFVSKGFPLCNITIHHSDDAQRDPIFNPVIHNTSMAFKMEALQQMQYQLNALQLNNSYKHLEQILNYTQSTYCLKKYKCDLVTDKNKLAVNAGFKPNLEGPLKISKSVIDSFIMEDYEGFPNNEVAWGMLGSIEQWDAILDLTRGYHDIIFNTTLVAKDVAQPLLKFIKDLLLNRKSKVTLLMAHDANVYTILKSMEFKPYTLKNQYEKVPAGGKLVFQKWWEENTGKSYAKIDYVYQGTEQMRLGKKLSMDKPPEFTKLELNGCQIDENGFCLWEDFVMLLDRLTKKV